MALSADWEKLVQECRKQFSKQFSRSDFQHRERFKERYTSICDAELDRKQVKAKFETEMRQYAAWLSAETAKMPANEQRKQLMAMLTTHLKTLAMFLGSSVHCPLYLTQISKKGMPKTYTMYLFAFHIIFSKMDEAFDLLNQVVVNFALLSGNGTDWNLLQKLVKYVFIECNRAMQFFLMYFKNLNGRPEYFAIEVESITGKLSARCSDVKQLLVVDKIFIHRNDDISLYDFVSTPMPQVVDAKHAEVEEVFSAELREALDANIDQFADSARELLEFNAVMKIFERCFGMQFDDREVKQKFYQAREDYCVWLEQEVVSRNPIPGIKEFVVEYMSRIILILGKFFNISCQMLYDCQDHPSYIGMFLNFLIFVENMVDSFCDTLNQLMYNAAKLENFSVIRKELEFFVDLGTALDGIMSKPLAPKPEIFHILAERQNKIEVSFLRPDFNSCDTSFSVANFIPVPLRLTLEEQGSIESEILSTTVCRNSNSLERHNAFRLVDDMKLTDFPVVMMWIPFTEEELRRASGVMPDEIMDISFEIPAEIAAAAQAVCNQGVDDNLVERYSQWTLQETEGFLVGNRDAFPPETYLAEIFKFMFAVCKDACVKYINCKEHVVKGLAFADGSAWSFVLDNFRRHYDEVFCEIVENESVLAAEEVARKFGCTDESAIEGLKKHCAALLHILIQAQLNLPPVEFTVPEGKPEVWVQFPSLGEPLDEEDFMVVFPGMTRNGEALLPPVISFAPKEEEEIVTTPVVEEKDENSVVIEDEESAPKPVPSFVIEDEHEEDDIFGDDVPPELPEEPSEHDEEKVPEPEKLEEISFVIEDEDDEDNIFGDNVPPPLPAEPSQKVEPEQEPEPEKQEETIPEPSFVIEDEDDEDNIFGDSMPPPLPEEPSEHDEEKVPEPEKQEETIPEPSLVIEDEDDEDNIFGDSVPPPLPVEPSQKAEPEPEPKPSIVIEDEDDEDNIFGNDVPPELPVSEEEEVKEDVIPKQTMDSADEEDMLFADEDRATPPPQEEKKGEEPDPAVEDVSFGMSEPDEDDFFADEPTFPTEEPPPLEIEEEKVEEEVAKEDIKEETVEEEEEEEEEKKGMSLSASISVDLLAAVDPEDNDMFADEEIVLPETPELKEEEQEEPVAVEVPDVVIEEPEKKEEDADASVSEVRDINRAIIEDDDDFLTDERPKSHVTEYAFGSIPEDDGYWAGEDEDEERAEPPPL